MPKTPLNKLFPFQDKNDSAQTVTSTSGATVVFGGTVTGDSGAAGIVYGNAEWLRCTVNNATGASTTNAFAVQIKHHVDDPAFHDYITGSAWDPASTNPNVNLCSATGPQELGPSAQAWFNVFIKGIHSYRFTAGVATSVATGASMTAFVTEA